MLTKTAAAATVLSLASLALAQPDGPMPRLNVDPKDTNNRVLVGKKFAWRELPYQVDTTTGDRGTQFGFNQCNATTAGDKSNCQTLIVNSLKDFCIWGPPERGTVGDTEGENVAYCVNPKNGGRPIPPGTIKSAQFIKAKSYVSLVAMIDQEKINIPANDDGGELDSGGQDQRGNPLGGVAYSSALPSANGVLSQSRMWHAFTGSGMTCMKFCDETAPNASGLCRHTFDTIGCYPAVPADYDALDNGGKFGVFLSCDGEDQDPVTPTNSRIPKSSNCHTMQSSDIFAAATGAPPAPSQTTSGTANSTNTPAPSQSGSGSASAPGSASQSAPASTTNVPKPPLTAGGAGEGTGPAAPSQTPGPGGAAFANTASVALVSVIALAAGAFFA